MRKIERMTQVIRSSDSGGLFHDTRGDVKILAKTLNAIIEKQNELIDVVNKLIEKEGKA